jgi:hypothetical protein
MERNKRIERLEKKKYIQKFESNTDNKTVTIFSLASVFSLLLNMNLTD